MHQIQYLMGGKFNFVSIWFNYSQNNDFGKHIDEPIMNLCLMRRWRLHGQCGRSFCQGEHPRCDTEQCISSTLTTCLWTGRGGAFRRNEWRKERLTKRQKERKTITRTNFCVWLYPVLCQRQIGTNNEKVIYHSRPKCMCVEDDRTSQERLPGLKKDRQTGNQG